MTNLAAQPEDGPENQHRHLAVELLEFGMNDLLTDRAFTSGREIAELTMIGLYHKILACLESVITLAERGLPAFAVMREMVEALISMAYIAAAGSEERANLYRDFIAVSRWKEANRRAQHHALAETVSASHMKSRAAARDRVVATRGQKVVDDMTDPRKWRTWAGKLTVRDMAKAAGLSDVTYLLAYAWPSQIIHGLDADSYFEINEEGIVRPARPKNPEASLLPGASATLVATEVIDKFFGLRKREAILRFKERIDRMTARKGATPNPQD